MKWATILRSRLLPPLGKNINEKLSMKKYCDDVKCPNFQVDCYNKCKLGFKIQFRLPKSMADVNNANWGYKMPKVCISKFNKHTATR